MNEKEFNISEVIEGLTSSDNEYFKSIMTGLVECLESAEQESKIKNKN